jgi:hypothetical protein
VEVICSAASTGSDWSLRCQRHLSVNFGWQGFTSSIFYLNAFLILFFLLLILLAPSVRAQTITLGPISKLAYCVGDTIIVPYETSGNFASDNYFFVEFSDAKGSFSSFTRFGNDTSKADSIILKLGATGSHFRLRVASTDPYLLSDSNAADIQVIALPNLQPTANTEWPFVGNAIQISDNEPAGSKFTWTFNDSDASIHTSQDSSPSIIYSHEGLKSVSESVTNSSGCSQTGSFSFNVLSCHPTIPSNVHIVTDSEEDHGFPFVWVKSGGSYKPDYSIDHQEVIFVEPGAYVWLIGSGDYVNIFYIRSGASINPFKGEYTYITVQDSGMLNPQSAYNVYCPDLTFDYSQIPSSVAENPPPTFSLIQSGDHLFANTEEAPAEIRIMNILGAEVLSQHGTGALDVDLSPLPAGVYFAMVQSGDAREVRKIAVVR